MVRGIDKSDIFKDDQDKRLFVERLGQSGHSALMGNARRG
jgi:hypothetical protein